MILIMKGGNGTCTVLKVVTLVCSIFVNAKKFPRELLQSPFLSSNYHLLKVYT